MGLKEHKRRILVFGDEKRLRAAVRVAICSDAEVSIEARTEALVATATEQQPDVLLYHLEHERDAGLESIRRIVAVCPEISIIALADPSPPTQMLTLLQEPWLDHLLATESPWFMPELMATLAKLRDNEIFGLSKYLPWGTKLVGYRIRGSRDKEPVFDAIAAYMNRLGIGGRMVTHLQAIADEMLMNAIYDAPVDKRGRARYAELDRSNPVELDAHEQPTLQIGSDGCTFGISMADPFGAIAPKTLRRYVAKGLRRGGDQINRDAGGAGLGLYLLYGSLHSMCLNVAPRRMTEFIGLVDIRGSFRAVAQTPKSLNIFQA